MMACIKAIQITFDPKKGYDIKSGTLILLASVSLGQSPWVRVAPIPLSPSLSLPFFLLRRNDVPAHWDNDDNGSPLQGYVI